MRRWNGWGDEAVLYPVPPSAARFIEQLIGPGKPPKDASLENVLNRVPSSRLPQHSLVSHDKAIRLKHARGQSAADWIALRSGIVDTFPDGVAYPEDGEQVQNLIRYAGEVGACLIPFGGGTSVVGHINPMPGDEPVLCVDLSHMNRLEKLDERSHLATFGAGVNGPDLEAQLRARGFTLGHFPQSFELSTLGGWVATRSSGQQSLGYGRIEKLFAGGTVETPAGRLVLPDFPASAAGPDLKEILLGSEGRLGIITQATVRISPLPQRENFHAVFLPDFERGMRAARQLLWAGIPLSMLRLSTPMETITTLALAGHDRLIGALERLLGMRGLTSDKCMLLMGFTGGDALVKAARKEALEITSHWGGVHVGRTFGDQWQKSRFRTPYLRNSLWEMGYLVDTLETAVDWDRVDEMVSAIEVALHTPLTEQGERVHVFTHLSHLYPTGSSIYTTYLLRLADEPQVSLQRWQSLKAAASRAIIEHGGTISHQHGVGLDHKEYLPAEKGPLGIGVLKAIFNQFDPQGIMNPGKLLE